MSQTSFWSLGGTHYYRCDTTVSLSYFLARSYCKAMGGELTTIKSLAQHTEIQSWLATSTYANGSECINNNHGGEYLKQLNFSWFVLCTV